MKKSSATNKSSLYEFDGMGCLKANVISVSSLKTLDAEGLAGIRTNNSTVTADGECITVTAVETGKMFHVFLDLDKSYDLTQTRNGKKCTVKLRLCIDDPAEIACDHEGGYAHIDYSNSCTVFLRAYTGHNSDACWCVNQTVEGKGWQEIEMTFDHHNGYSPEFDLSRVGGFYLMAVSKKAGATFKISDLRFAEYTNEGYVPDLRGMPEGAELVSTGDYDGLYGEVITEWYASDFDPEVKMFGKSSYMQYVNGEDDYRMYIGNLSMKEFDKEKDHLCFYMTCDNYDAISSVFIELNQVQDRHEYQRNNALDLIKENHVGPMENGKWMFVTLPLSQFNNGAQDPELYGDKVKFYAFRLVNCVPKGTEARIYLDTVFIATAEQLATFSPDKFLNEVNG